MIFESFLLNCTVALVLIVALTFDYVTKFFSYWYVRHIPYKTPVPFYGSDYHRVLGLRSNTEEVNKLYHQHKEGLVGSIKSRMPDLTVKAPDLIKKVLSTAFENFQSRGIDLDKTRDVCLKDNLFYVDGEKWTLLREGFELLLRDVTCSEDGLAACLAGTNGDTNVQELLSKVLDVVFKNLLEVEGAMISDIRSKLQKRTPVNKVKSYLRIIFPSLYNLFGLVTLHGEPSERTSKNIQESKLFKKAEAIFQKENKNKRKINTDDLNFGILIAFINEGYFPCLNTLTAVFYELAKNEDMQRKLRKSNEYVEAVIKETLRLYPPYSVVTRKCVKTYKFPEINEGKVLIDRRVTMNIPVEALHRDDAYYKDANVFNPDRFLNDDPRDSYVYLPFGGGPRKCIGEQLSLQIIRSVIKVVLNNYEVKLSKKSPNQLTMVDYNFGRVIDKEVWALFQPIKC